MRWGKIFVFGAFIFASVANAQDVTVDLSVLDDLGAPETNISQPLFPVLPKKTAVEIKKTAKKEKVNSVKKNFNKKNLKKVVVEVKPADEDILVVDVEPVSNSQKRQEVAEQKKAESVEVSIKDDDTVIMQAAQTSTSVEDGYNKGVVDAPTVDVVEKTEAPVVNEDVTVASSKIVEENNKKDLIIKESVVEEPTVDYIKFDEGVDELNDVQMQEIDKIVSKYGNGPKNKISIYSYNYDDGVDSFKKKRVSLNRALGIRSYLLKNGYKNFSIKVININPPSDKINTVELQEI